MKLTLYYFKIPFWRAEVTRLSLFINNIDFVDHRISEEEYEVFKKKGELPSGKIAPFRQLPVLEVEDKIIGQTCAIARYCGKLSGMYPLKDDLSAAKIDQILDAAQDINYIVSISGREKKLDKKLIERKRLAEHHLPKWFKFLEKLLIENIKKYNSKWFVGNTMSIADLAIWRLTGWLISGKLEGVPNNILEPYKNIVNMREEVYQHPKVKEWMLIKYNGKI